MKFFMKLYFINSHVPSCIFPLIYFDTLCITSMKYNVYPVYDATIFVLNGHCIEFKYYADGIHSGLTSPGKQ